MIEVQGEDGVVAGVPGVGGNGEMDDDEAFDGLIGIDARLAQKRRGGLRGGEFPEGREAGEEVLELGVLDGAGGRLEGAVVGDERGGEVFKEEGKAEPVDHANGDDGVEIILRGIVADDVRV